MGHQSAAHPHCASVSTLQCCTPGHIGLVIGHFCSDFRPNFVSVSDLSHASPISFSAASSPTSAYSHIRTFSLFFPITTHIHSKSLTLYSPAVTVCTASLTCSNPTFCPHSVFMCFVWISEQTAIISLYSIN
jgi:hypothetical protein